MPVLVQVLGQHWANTFRSTGPMLNHYYPSTGPIQLAGTGPVLGQYIAPALAQCWTSIGPTLGQYLMPALARFTASVQRMHWANAVYTGMQVLAPVLAQYCHVCWVLVCIYQPLVYGPYLHPWLLATTVLWYRYCNPQHILRSPLQELWLLCNLITCQYSDAGRMALPAWNMLSAFFYSPHVGLTSYFCELDINPYFLAITAERLENKY